MPPPAENSAQTASRVRIVAAETKHLDDVRALFREYAATLPYSLCFQGFDQELATLPGRYAPPSGRLLLAFDGPTLVGSVALRHIGPGSGICEMKRLYVRPTARGTGLGRQLAEAIVREARDIGYTHMRLDTDPGMKAAQHVYESIGFRYIQRYNDDPMKDTIFMELTIADSILSQSNHSTATTTAHHAATRSPDRS